MWLLGVFHSICNAFTSFYAAALADAAVELRIPTNERIVNQLILILRLFFMVSFAQGNKKYQYLCDYINFVKAFQCGHLPLKGVQILCRGIADLHSGIYVRNIKINLDIFRGNIIFIFTV